MHGQHRTDIQFNVLNIDGPELMIKKCDDFPALLC